MHPHCPEASEIQSRQYGYKAKELHTNYEISTNKLRGITRGTRGTTPNTLILSGAEVRNGQETENIRLVGGDGRLVRDPELYNWIRLYRYLIIKFRLMMTLMELVLTVIPKMELKH